MFGLEPGMQYKDVTGRSSIFAAHEYVVSAAVGVEKKGKVEMEYVSVTKEMEEGGATTTTTTTTTGADKGYDTSQKTLTPTDSMKMRSSSKLQSTSDLGGETWEKHLDPASGRVFFHNKQKGVTQWNEPPGFSNSK